MCAWAAGTYTKGNNGTGGWAGDASLGIGIEAGRHDTQDNDFATGINQCINKDGSNAFTGNPNLGGFIPTNLGAGTAAAPALCVNNDVNTGIFGPAADTWAVATNGSERLRVDSTGRIGIGTTSPSFALDLQSTTCQLVPVRFSNDASSGGLYLRKSRAASVGTNTIVQDGDQLGVVAFQGANGTSFNEASAIYGEVDGTPGASNDMPGRLRFLTCANGTATLSERMRIDSAGNVGIGVTPTTRLHVSGAQTASQVVQTAASLSNGSYTYFIDSTVHNSNLSSAGALRVATNPVANALIVDGNGRVGIGTNAPGSQLTLSTDSAAKPTTNTWTIVSDERIKTNVQPYPKGLAEICQVNPITYDYNGKGGMAAGPGGVSILAQELQPVFPECVGSYKAKLEEADEEETDILNYNGHAITFALINAVKELNTKVEALEAQVEMLQTQVAIA